MMQHVARRPSDEIAQLRAENERLRKALTEVFEDVGDKMSGSVWARAMKALEYPT